MSDSLRDQLMKAGFKDTQPTRTERKKNRKASGAATQRKKPDKNTEKNNAAAETAAIAAKKKQVKEKIKTLIEADKVKDHSGGVTYSYQLGTRVKQLFVSEDCQKLLAAGELLITRLNGNTYLVPPATGEQILALNPDWAVIGANLRPDKSDDIDETYADYQIPDDLAW